MKYLLRPIFAIILLTVTVSVAHARVQLGIDVLEAHDFSILNGKRVGLVTNQTSVDSHGTKTRVAMNRARNFKLVALYSPEHGINGTVGAGKYVASTRDRLTGLPIYSIYGPHREPTPQMLRGIDVLVYDLQDIGCRSYTYVSTMIKCMEACGKLGIEFVVLDRPNPLGGERIGGPPMESKWISFVGQIPVPYVHGMTVGELARMANAKGWSTPRCKLEVVRMSGWHRNMTWADTGLRWHRTSPNIPYAMSPSYYVATGLAGELGGMETGCGGPTPFQIFATKYLNSSRLTRYMNSLDFHGVKFSPYDTRYFHGVRISISPNSNADLCAIGMQLMVAANRAESPNIFAHTHSSELSLFYKCYGSTLIHSQLDRRIPAARIIASWKGFHERFAQERSRYLLY